MERSRSSFDGINRVTAERVVRLERFADAFELTQYQFGEFSSRTWVECSQVVASSKVYSEQAIVSPQSQCRCQFCSYLSPSSSCITLW